MPGWPTVDRADDRQLVAVLRHADPNGPDRLYGAYAERLYDYACSLLGECDGAADAVHDALVTAQGRAERLRDAVRLRAWLYALTRFQAVARLGHRGAERPARRMLDEPDDPELTALVHETLGELRGPEREVLELSVRHGLTPAEVSGVLGLTSRQAAGRLTRARTQLENTAAAVVLARTGRAHCPDLSAMVDSWEGPLTPLLRRRLAGHIAGCEVCTERRQRAVSAERLLDLVPVAFPPLSLRERVIGTCLDPEQDATRTLITDRGDSFDRTGFPVAPQHRSRRRRPRRLAPALLAGALLMAGTSVTVALSSQEGANTALRAPAPAAPPPPDEDYAADSPEPGAETDAEPTPGESPTTGATTGGTTGGIATPPPTRRPAVGVATTRPAAIEGAAQVRLRARNAAITWDATATNGLGVHPASGTIKAGASAAVWVTVDDPGLPGGGTVSFTSNGGAVTCALTWEGQPGRPSEQPDEEPTPSPEPSSTPTETLATVM
ncbi:sigma factor-like helix-turn-helix DNA-binding protein [Nonomuraea sp. SBT364]|uniref:sigma factor-like helix-turn-helix DNA-binding protein n=1 Tax=Nonomuraea sp. SBT364 TaxID=1580530 RepID=UPI00066AEFB3|nr:sigma factor-like helix-turn-helix DNA-binding protein [Nonomuraea sp. SBT364]